MICLKDFGEAVGWVCAVCFFISVADFFVKFIFKSFISKLPKDNKVKPVYQIFMKIVVKYHRYFGMAAGALAAAHLCIMLAFSRISYSGIIVTALMALTAVLGIVIAYGHKRDAVKLHRPAAFVVLAVIIFHMATKI